MEFLVAFKGPAGCGKDTAANAVLAHFDGFRKVSFADGVREFAGEIDSMILPDGRRYNELLAEYGYEVAKRKFPAVRDFLVRIGAGARRVFGDTVWIDRELRPRGPCDCVVVSDLRYANEAARVRELGGWVIEIDNPSTKPANEEEAASLASVVPDVVVRNDCSKEEYEQRVLAQVQELYLRRER